jgi:hypothetical protein
MSSDQAFCQQNSPTNSSVAAAATLATAVSMRHTIGSKR